MVYKNNNVIKCSKLKWKGKWFHCQVHMFGILIRKKELFRYFLVDHGAEKFVDFMGWGEEWTASSVEGTYIWVGNA